MALNATQNEDWRSKYQDAVHALERDERKYQSQLQALAKLVGRLCLAAQGQSPRLDTELKRLKDAVRNEMPAESLETLGKAVADAVHEIDHGTATLSVLRPEAEAATAKLSEERIRVVLRRLVDELNADPQLLAAANLAELATPIAADQLPVVVERIGGLVVQHIRALERARRDLEQLLGQMVAQLDSLTRYVQDTAQDESQRSSSNEALNMQISGEMQAMGESVATGTDLGQLRIQLRQRLDSIGRHLQDFRHREQERSRVARERTEQMRGRMDEMESEARKLQARLTDEKRLSMRDPLTQIPNRLAYEQRIADELDRWKRFAQPTCIAVWDIDSFKAINDSYGHRAGDKVLSVVAECLAKSIRATDFVARYGGEEFVMVLPGTSAEDAVRLANQMREAVSQLGFHFRGTPVSITISCGITALVAGDSAGDAFDRADHAMYSAKQAGRNCVVSA